MSEINDGGAAFPQAFFFDQGEHVAAKGMSLRDYFAGQALAGMCSGLTKFRSERNMEDIIVNRPADISEIAYVYADAMLRAREVQP